jgi:branched-chain amino acid transport system substrate-binding protein
MGRMSLARRAGASLLVLGLLAAACGDDDTTTAGGPETTASGAGGGLTGDIKIGTHWCLTGTAAYAGTQLVKGTDLAVEEINETGFLGEATIDVVNEDDATDNAQAVTIAQRLINQENVVAIVGGCTSGATLAAVPVAEEAGIPWLVGNAVAPGIAAEGEYIFRTSMPYTPIFDQIVEEVFPTLEGNRVALVYGNDNPSQVSFADDYRRFMGEAGGYEIVVDEGIRDADTDFSAILTRIESEQADILLPMLLGPQAANFVLQARRAGIDAQVVGQQGHNTPDLYEIAGEAAVGWILPSTWALEEDNAQNEHFVELYRERYGEDPDLYAANGYTAMRVMAQAIKDAGVAEPEAINEALDAMTEVEVPLGDGIITFDEEGEGSQTGVIMELKEDGSFGLWTADG